MSERFPEFFVPVNFFHYPGSSFLQVEIQMDFPSQTDKKLNIAGILTERSFFFPGEPVVFQKYPGNLFLIRRNGFMKFDQIITDVAPDAVIGFN